MLSLYFFLWIRSNLKLFCLPVGLSRSLKKTIALRYGHTTITLQLRFDHLSPLEWYVLFINHEDVIAHFFWNVNDKKCSPGWLAVLAFLRVTLKWCLKCMISPDRSCRRPLRYFYRQIIHLRMLCVSMRSPDIQVSILNLAFHLRAKWSKLIPSVATCILTKNLRPVGSAQHLFVVGNGITTITTILHLC